MRLPRLFRTQSFQLAAFFALVFAGAALLLTAAIYWTTSQALRSDYLASIASDIGAISAGYQEKGVSEAIEVINQRTAVPGFPSYYVLQNASGQKIAGNLSAKTPTDGIATVAPPPGTRNAREHEVIGRGVHLSKEDYLFVGADTYQMAEAEETILHTLLWVLAGTLLLSVAGGALFSRGFLRRADSIARTCQAIIGGKFDDRIPLTGARDEWDDLASALNRMLDRITELMENLRQVSGDVAHDLRTPLTRLRQRLEHAKLEAKTPDEYAQAVDRAIEDTDGILSIFSSLLNLSRIEAGSRMASFQPVNLSDLLRDVANIYVPLVEDKAHTLTATLQPSVSIMGDRVLLMQMSANLVENAIHHTPPGTAIGMELTRSDGGVRVIVRDNGPGIPAEHRDKVFQRFWRGEASRNLPGYGLGMPLVSAIAALHSARLGLSDNNPGLSITLDFPPPPP